MSLKLSDLFATGSIVALHVSRWGARTKLRPVDLGIEPTIDVQKALNLGHNRLAPRDVFDDINEAASRAAKAIDINSLNFAMIPGTRYVPDTNLAKLVEILKIEKVNFYQAVDTFIAEYEMMKQSMFPVIERALKDAAKDQASARKAFAKIVMDYPSATEIRNKFALRWNIYTIQGAKDKAAIDALTDEAGEVRSIVRSMVEQLRNEVQAKIGSMVDLIGKGGKLKNKSLASAQTLITRIKQLNLFGDTVLDNQLKIMEDYLKGFDPKNKDAQSEIKEGFEDISEALKASIEEAVQQAEDNLTSVGRRRFSLKEESHGNQN